MPTPDFPMPDPMCPGAAAPFAGEDAVAPADPAVGLPQKIGA